MSSVSIAVLFVAVLASVSARDEVSVRLHIVSYNESGGACSEGDVNLTGASISAQFRVESKSKVTGEWKLLTEIDPRMGFHGVLKLPSFQNLVAGVQLRLLQLEHGGGSCNCWRVEEALLLWGRSNRSILQQTHCSTTVSTTQSLFCGGSASSPRGLISTPVQQRQGGDIFFLGKMKNLLQSRPCFMSTVYKHKLQHHTTLNQKNGSSLSPPPRLVYDIIKKASQSIVRSVEVAKRLKRQSDDLSGIFNVSFSLASTDEFGTCIGGNVAGLGRTTVRLEYRSQLVGGDYETQWNRVDDIPINSQEVRFSIAGSSQSMPVADQGCLQFRLVQEEHGGAFCNCWSVQNLQLENMGNTTNFTITRMVRRLLCVRSASLRRILTCTSCNVHECTNMVESDTPRRSPFNLSESCLAEIPRLQIFFQIILQANRNRGCDEIDNPNEGIEFSLRFNNETWIPVIVVHNGGSPNQWLPIGDFSNLVIRDYFVEDQVGSNIVNVSLVLCNIHGFSNFIQFRWLQTCGFNGQNVLQDFWGLDNLRISYVMENREAVLLSDSFGDDSLNSSVWPIEGRRDANLSTVCTGDNQALTFGLNSVGIAGSASRSIRSAPISLDASPTGAATTATDPTSTTSVTSTATNPISTTSAATIATDPTSTTSVTTTATDPTSTTSVATTATDPTSTTSVTTTATDPTSTTSTDTTATDPTSTTSATTKATSAQMYTSTFDSAATTDHTSISQAFTSTASPVENVMSQVLNFINKDSALKAVTETDYVKAIDLLANLTASAGAPEPAVTLFLLGDILNRFNSSKDEEIATQMFLKIGENLIASKQSNHDVLGGPEVIGSSLLSVVDRLALKVFPETGNISTGNISIQALLISNARKDDYITTLDSSDINSNFTPQDIQIPLELIQMFVNSSLEESEEVRVIASLFNNVENLFPNGRPGINNSKLGSGIVSTSLQCGNSLCDTQSIQLHNPVIITIQHSEMASELEKFYVDCVFWNFASSSSSDVLLSSGEWSNDGCYRNDKLSNASKTVCECYHLTHFAILLSPVELDDLSEGVTLSLEVISFVGVTISLVAMTITIVTFIFLRSLHNMRNYIHINLCINLMIAQLIFIVGIDRSADDHVPVHCQAIAVLLHYFFLVSFMWMLMEGVVLYVVLVLVFVKKTKYYMIGFTIASYGIPLLYMGLTLPLGLALNNKHYGTTSFCFLDPETLFIWAFIAPVIVIILINIVLFLIVARGMWKHQKTRTDKSKIDNVKRWLRSAVFLVIVMGLTWIMGVLVLEVEALLPLAYIFTIMVACQGLFIFIIFVLFSKQVRDAYKKWVKTKVTDSTVFSRVFGDSFTAGIGTDSSRKTSLSARNFDVKKKMSITEEGIAQESSFVITNNNFP